MAAQTASCSGAQGMFRHFLQPALGSPAKCTAASHGMGRGEAHGRNGSNTKKKVEHYSVPD